MHTPTTPIHNTITGKRNLNCLEHYPHNHKLTCKPHTQVGVFKTSKISVRPQHKSPTVVGQFPFSAPRVMTIRPRRFGFLAGRRKMNSMAIKVGTYKSSGCRREAYRFGRGLVNLVINEPQKNLRRSHSAIRFVY